MRVELSKTFRFEAAHFLPKVPGEHRCRRAHGHSYRVTVSVGGEVDPETGWLVDYADIAKASKPVINELDHHDLNEVTGLANPTAEHLCAWLWARIAPELPNLSCIEIAETETTRCVFRGD